MNSCWKQEQNKFEISHGIRNTETNGRKIQTLGEKHSSEEINSLVDLILEKNSQLFGSLSASFTLEGKNTVWDDIASGLSALHGTSRNREDVLKK